MGLWTTMCKWLEPAFAALWSNAIVIVPLAALAYFISLVPRSRPATRHGAWLVAMCWCLLPPVLPVFRVQIDDHTPLTPLSVPYSAGGDSISTSSPSAGSISTAPMVDPDQPFEASAFGPVTLTTNHSGKPASGFVPAIISISREVHNEQPASDSSVAGSALRDSPPTVCGADRLDVRSPASGSGAPQLDACHRRSRISSLNEVRLGFVERQGLIDDVECTSLAPCDSPLPWNPHFDVASAPTIPDHDSPVHAVSAPDNKSLVENSAPDDLSDSHVVESARDDVPNSVSRSAPESWGGWMPVGLRRWIAALVGVRDAMGRLPVIPTSMWLAGTLFTATAFCISALICRRRFRGASPASRETRQLVALAAKKMGLSRPPSVRMMSRPMSPMIWCGRRPTLLLPVELWNELDHTGRLAVLFHELAHLRRRDHLVCRISIAAACLYWWNPLVWWIRSRLHEEAESCCDAWVTWLLPQNRRTYADALIRARKYLSCPFKLSPVLGMSTSRKSTQRFARRLTMVMTKRFAPRRGSFGFVVLAVLAMTGWVATPASSSPTSDDERIEDLPAQGDASVEQDVRLAFAPPEAKDEPRIAVISGNRRGKKADDVDDRFDRLERQVEQLTMQVQELAQLTRNSQDAYAKGREIWQEHARRQAEMALQFQQQRQANRGRGIRGAPAGNVIIKKYEMPEGILEAFIKLMARDDVPVIISPAKDHVVVHGSPETHAIVGAFITIVSQKSQEQTQAYKLSEGKLKDLSDLMIRDDVPVRVRPGEDEITVYGPPAEQAIFKAFVDLISPTPKQRQTAPRAGIGAKEPKVLTYYQAAEAAAKRAVEAAALGELSEQVQSLPSQAQLQYIAAAKLEQAKAEEQLKKALEEVERKQRELEAVRNSGDSAR